MRDYLSLLLAAVALSLVLAVPAEAGPQRWVAVAARNANSQPYTAWGYTQDDAYRNATARCERDNDAGCQVYASWTNSCRYIVQSRGTWDVFRSEREAYTFCGYRCEVTPRCSD